MRQASEFGVPVQEVSVDLPTVINRKEMLIRGIREDLYRNIARSQAITYIEDEARFRSPTELEIGDKVYEVEKTIIAAGSRIGIPSIASLDQVEYFTSHEALDLRNIPSPLLIVGGGYMALEFAQMYAGFGSEVTLLGRNPQIAPTEDGELTQALAEYMEEAGITLHTAADVTKVYEEGGNRVALAKIDGEDQKFRAEVLMIATGRTPNGDRLGLENTEVEVNDTTIEVDDRMQTNDPHIWALGDVTGGYMFTHMATAEGPYAALNAVKDAQREVDYRVVPRAVFTNPPIASVGLTEQEAIDAGYEIRLGTAHFAHSGRAQAHGQAVGMVKLIADAETGILLGGHIFGPHADDLIHEIVAAMHNHGTYESLARSIHSHPTLSEVIRKAARKLR